VRVEYYRNEGPPVESFVIDIAGAIKTATARDDEAAARMLRSLWLDHFHVELPARNSSRLMEYLLNRAIWREDGEWTVIKTAGEPCITYTAEIDQTDEIVLIALGACYRYPHGSEDAWWTQIIRPRLGRL